MKAASCSALLALSLAACDGSTSAADTGAADSSGSGDTGSADTGAPPDAAVPPCFDFSDDPDLPLAIDGVFTATSPRWRRPHDDPAVCPASALTPATASDVPFVAFAFCNPDGAPHTYSVEMLAQPGAGGEPALDDPYLFLYDGEGIPADPLACRAVNDDIEGAIDTGDAEILDVTVPAGAAITVVGTAFTFEAATGTGVGGYVLVVTNTD